MVARSSNASLSQDSDLERRVGNYLATQHRPALRNVEVIASDGVVTLRGSVTSYYEKQLSTKLASRVAGVLQIRDKVWVNASFHVQSNPYQSR
jgi:osmotically-inducible protein OsmY